MVSREDALANPGGTNAAVDKLVGQAAKVEKPTVPLPPSDIVDLPSGYIRGDDVIKTVQVQELTGRHEESLARAVQPRPGTNEINWANFLTVLLECGTVKVGDLPQAGTKEYLQDMLLGDRDAIILGIRQATYGDEVELIGWQCPACGGQSDLILSLANDVETVKLAPSDQTFEVKLRKGRTALVRLASGSDLRAMYEKDGLNTVERQSVLLGRTLKTLVEADGTEMDVAGFAQTIVMGLSIPDRKSIIRELNLRQPGPRYNEITLVHQDCQKEVPLAIGLGDLFPDLV
jgi:hypothetical protein